MVLGNVISIFLYAVVYVHDYSYDSIYACPLFLFLIIIKLFIASSRATIDLILHPYPYKKTTPPVTMDRLFDRWRSVIS